ncbi:MAG TPA: rod-binding protein [Candidatus Krumholzibacteria bacterium]|nr:rod-binding protein [Candidatus Krumholzibacteria bacterium]
MSDLHAIGVKPTVPASSKTEVSPELMEAAREFESLLLNTMIKAMRDSVTRSDLFGDTKHVETYEQMLDQEYAKAMSRQGGLGFARMIVEQLGGEQDPGAGLESLRNAASRLQAAKRGYEAYGEAASAVRPDALGGER